jgi:hypothetical protein
MRMLPVIKPTCFVNALIIVCTTLLPSLLFSQENNPTDTTVIAGKYDRKKSYENKWGKHYRKEWSTPVKFNVVYLDTLAGGLKPYESGGGRQSKSLRLKDKDGREYVLRSIDKSFGKALPEIYQGTFIEAIINDQVTIGHPYSAVVIAPLAEAAGILHTNPEIIFIPQQPALDSFNKEFGNQLYLFEQRPDENWETAKNFGNSKNIVGTDKMLEELLEDNEHQVDQLLYIRSRLFDFLINDWGRHEDQWRWASFKEVDKKIFKPIPRDRDQAFTKFDGKWLQKAISAGDINHLQSFDTTIRDINTFNFPARNLDRRVSNQPSLDKWTEIARDIQRSLTDKVIEDAVKRLPAEVFPISGNDIIEKLKTRRNRLVEYATTYYKFLAKEVEIVGSDKKELFEIDRGSTSTIVKGYALSKKNKLDKEPFYQRTFQHNETDEIRLYGLGDDDLFQLAGKANNGILIRIVGGDGKDILIDSSSVSGSKKLTQVYDTEDSRMLGSSETRLHITNDSSLNNYEYKSFEYDKKGFGVKPGFFSLTFGFNQTRNEWRKEPTGVEHSFKAKYSINRAAVYLDYKSTFYQVLGKWNAFIGAGAGIPNVVNFFGVGNNTSFETYDRRYFRLRSQEYYGRFGINRIIGKSMIELGGLYQTVRIKADSSRYVKEFVNNGGSNYDLDRKHFISTDLSYKYINTDHPFVPSKGFKFSGMAGYTHNLTTPDNSFARLSSDVSAYIPLVNFISLGLRAGGAANIGDAEFYQLNTLGSHDNLRGFRKWRFYGKQMFYNNNELRFMFDARNKLFNGKYGFITFFDNGRVWQPGEISNKWHSAYGVGGFVSLFNKVILSGSYGKSKEDDVISFYFGFYF